MRKENKKTKKSLIVTLMVLTFSIFTLHAKDAESARNKVAVNGEKIITVKIMPATAQKKPQGNSEQFNLVKNEDKKDKLSLSLSKKNDLDLGQKNGAFTQKSNQKNAAVINDASRYLKKEFKANKIEQTFFTTTIFTLVALNVADYFSTKEALKHPELSEANPIMKPFVKNSYVFAGVKIGMTVLSTTLLSKLHKKDKTTAWVVSFISNFALSYVVASNIKLINKVNNR